MPRIRKAMQEYQRARSREQERAQYEIDHAKNQKGQDGIILNEFKELEKGARNPTYKYPTGNYVA